MKLQTDVVPHIHPRLLIGMLAPAIREMLHLLRADCSLHMSMRVLAERVACIVRNKALHCVSVPCKRLCSNPSASHATKCKLPRDMCSASPSALHLQTTRRRDMTRSSLDTFVGEPLREAIPAPLMSHVHFVNHGVLLHLGIL